ncbi:MAG: acetyl-CoA carboxylase, carboxyltransferase subunit beta [Chloroflexi bacterium]|nr:acetyl-CoA carboxylase, carboxyltransferase subunit beta [Chloroflexota bacterium]
MKSLADLLISIVPHRHQELPATSGNNCPDCQTDLGHGAHPLYQRFRVCDVCGHHFQVSARDRIAQLADAGTFHEVNRSLASVDPLSFSDRVSYRQRLDDARRRTGATEAVVTGTCRVGGVQAVLAVLDFEFLGGSMGSVVGEKVTLALELASRRRLPIVTVSTSGGARMQEGMLSLVQMAKTAAAARKLHEASQPFISILANPTTGGIYASYASLGDVIVAEPHALIGFAGPRVVEMTMHQALPDEVHRAEYLLAHGAIDLVVERPALRERLISLLTALSPRTRPTEPIAEPDLSPRPSPDSDRPAWEVVQLARRPDRPTSMELVREITSDFVELHGDRAGGEDSAIVIGIADLDGRPVAIIAEQRGSGTDGDPTRGGRPMPEGYRKARRLMGLAAKFSLPLLTFIDTPGAYAGIAAEERGLAGALAECLSYMSGIATPTIAVVVGEGGSGGALALGVADRILMLENAIYSVIAPEGAAAILYHDAARAEEIAASLRITAADCFTLGVIDEIVPEPEGGAHADPVQAARLLKLSIEHALAELQRMPMRKISRARYQKFRRMGQYNHHFNLAVAREVSLLQEYMQKRVHDIRGWFPRSTDTQPTEKAPAEPLPHA